LEIKMAGRQATRKEGSLRIKNVGRSTSIEIKSMGMRYMHNVAQKQVGSSVRRQLER